MKWNSDQTNRTLAEVIQAGQTRAVSMRVLEPRRAVSTTSAAKPSQQTGSVMSKPFPSAVLFRKLCAGELRGGCARPAAARRDAEGAAARSTATAPIRSSRRARPYHWFAGDGMIHAFHIENGKVSYRNRWVRTPKWEIENKGRRACPAPSAIPRTTDPRCWRRTRRRQHQHRLACRQTARARRRPRAVRARSRDAWRRTATEIAGAQGARFTAHPKIDPETGEMIFFGYSAKGGFRRRSAYGVIDRRRQASRGSTIRGAVSEHGPRLHRHAELRAVPGVAADRQHGARDGAASRPIAWEPEKGAYIGVMPRDAEWRVDTLVRERSVLRLPSDEHLGRRRQDRRRRDAVREGAAVSRLRRLARRAGRRGAADPLDVRSRRQDQHVQAGARSTISPASSRASTSASPGSISPWLFRREQRPQGPQDRVRYPRAYRPQDRQARRSISSPAGDACPSRCSCRAGRARRRRRLSARSSIAAARTAAISPCSTQRPGPGPAARGRTVDAACRSASTATGGRQHKPPNHLAYRSADAGIPGVTGVNERRRRG